MIGKVGPADEPRERCPTGRLDDDIDVVIGTPAFGANSPPRLTATGGVVGTVHYMAPEIGAGNYDRGIDIYALGALLFEMLTGQVPFFGSSTAEVLMKHLGTTVDTSGIEEPFARPTSVEWQPCWLRIEGATRLRQRLSARGGMLAAIRVGASRTGRSNRW